ncbi:efflux RND transporter periplasmic adaptor subunit [Alteromonas oceani]|jgi:RND family efflux transporter MFP subunit|uniref:Efflux RND transporter periplasmic adaptor subunit n=2 Tax=Alteromonas TaxID=226 RepID=A0A2S9VEL2_9ALTE|nr:MULTISPECIES: efflux RND transporter periplasmic adaptor subunit [Alteromonas]PRO74864.1 efflux RND transporter periplasmic adaptor subunit [Alteromonas alba]
MKLIRVILPIAIIVLGIGAMKTVTALGDTTEENESVDTRPTVRVTQLKPESFAINIEAFGELAPLESTRLAAQVSGEVVEWNPTFVAGGIVKRGEMLFSIEKDAYTAALLQAESALANAQAALIEEKALANVAEREAATLPNSRVTDLYLRKPQILSAEAAVKAAQAQMKIAKRDLANTEVVAPYDALIVSRSIGKGDFLTVGTSAATLYNVEVGEVTFPLARFDQAFLPEALNGIEATVSLLNGTTDEIKRSATIVRDSGIYDSATRMTHLVARVNDPYGLTTQQPVLRFGAYTKVSFTGKTIDNVYRIPQELITRRQLWILDEADKLVAKPVEVVREVDSEFLIRVDIAADDRIVMTLPEYPQNGMAVKVIEGADKLVAKQP